MNFVQKTRNNIASQLGIELTVDEVTDSIQRCLVLCELVRGVDWSWLRDATTTGEILAARWRLEEITGDVLSMSQFNRLRDIILDIDTQVNP